MKGAIFRRVIIKPFKRPQTSSCAYADRNCNRNGDAAFDRHRAKQTRDCKNRTHREIDTAADDDECHAQGHDVDDGGLANDTGEVDGGEKVRRRDGQRNCEND